MDVNLETIDERPEREEQQEAEDDTFYLEDPVELKTWEGFFDPPVRSEAEGTPSVAEAKRENKRYLTSASKNKTKLFKDITHKKGSLTKEKIEKVSRGFYESPSTERSILFDNEIIYTREENSSRMIPNLTHRKLINEFRNVLATAVEMPAVTFRG